MHRQHDRVSDRVRADRRLCAEHMRFAGVGHCRPSGPTQLRLDVLHARGGRPARPHGVWSAGVAGVWPKPGPAVRVAC